jgi:hypothetical protein
MIPFLRKAFLYGSAVSLLRRSGFGYLAAGILVAALLAAIEAAQTQIAGRTADITDPILAVLMAGALYCLEACPRIIERPRPPRCEISL